MRTILIAALLCTASMFLPCAHAQQSDADRQALAELRAKAGKGDAESQSKLGTSYRKGEGVPQDYTEAEKWYRKAADQGYARAQADLGVCYSLGEGVPKDHAEAVKRYRKDADQNDAVAQGNPNHETPVQRKLIRR